MNARGYYKEFDQEVLCDGSSGRQEQTDAREVPEVGGCKVQYAQEWRGRGGKGMGSERRGGRGEKGKGGEGRGGRGEKGKGREGRGGERKGGQTWTTSTVLNETWYMYTCVQSHPRQPLLVLFYHGY